MTKLSYRQYKQNPPLGPPFSLSYSFSLSLYLASIDHKMFVCFKTEAIMSHHWCLSIVKATATLYNNNDNNNATKTCKIIIIRRIDWL